VLSRASKCVEISGKSPFIVPQKKQPKHPHPDLDFAVLRVMQSASAPPQLTEGPVLGKRKQPCESALGDGNDTETILDGRDISPDNLKRIKTAYDKNSLVCVSFLTGAKCDELILEQWRNVLLKQEWTEKYRMKICGHDGTVLDVDNTDHHKEFVKSVVGPLDPKVR